MDKLFAELTEAHGISGFESEVAKIMVRELKKVKGYDVSVDPIGNVVARREFKKGAKTVMIGAHMDEIGLMVKSVTKEGFLRFIKIGGIDNRMLLNQRVVLVTDSGKKIYGVIGSKPIHMMKDDERKQVIEHDKMFIDVGAKDKKSVERLGIRIGTPAVFDISTEQLSGGYWTGKAVDDRAGCYALILLAKKLSKSKYNVLLVGTMGEEVSSIGKGAAISAYREFPDYFIALDTAIANDHPEVSLEQQPVETGKGPAITLVEASARGNIASSKMVKWLISNAKKKKIPYQLEAVEGGATDASRVYGVKTGIPSVAVGIPTRYIHSGVGIVSTKDIDLTVKLLSSCLSSPIE